ncbi:MAG: iron chelate uptake ABC transporter family permease subunit [Dehalococcoidia bacterium]
MDSVIEAEFRLHQRRLRNNTLAVIGAALVLLAIIVGAVAVGSFSIPVPDIFRMVLLKILSAGSVAAYPVSMQTILFDIRLPRILMAGLVGAALAVSGAAYQGMFRNPLADPYLTGISQGAALGAVAGFLLPLGIPAALIPVLAFAGALICVIAVYSIARTGKTLPMTTVILGGVAIGAFLASITSYLIIISGDRLHGIIFWLLGNFSLADWWSVAIMTPYILAGVIVILVFARPLNIMQLDEEQAQQLGINVERVKIVVLAAATIATAAAVCFCGVIGFVGIIVPHALRLVFGPDYRLLLPMSLFTGAGFLILADTAARTALAPTEIPVGIITALIGAPFFLYILTQKKKAIF